MRFPGKALQRPEKARPGRRCPERAAVDRLEKAEDDGIVAPQVFFDDLEEFIGRGFCVARQVVVLGEQLFKRQRR